MKASLQVKTKLFWLISVFSCDEVFLLIAAPPSTEHKGSLNSLVRMMQILCYGLHSHQIWAQFNKPRVGTILNSIFAWNKPHWHFLGGVSVKQTWCGASSLPQSESLHSDTDGSFTQKPLISKCIVNQQLSSNPEMLTTRLPLWCFRGAYKQIFVTFGKSYETHSPLLPLFYLSQHLLFI